MPSSTAADPSADGFALTVLGPIAPAALGTVYPHEHLLTGPPEPIPTEDPDLVLDDPRQVLGDLADFSDAGGTAIVELTTPDYGRDVAGLAQLSRDSQVTLIAATGFNKALFSARLLDGVHADELADRFTAEIVSGVDGTGVHCGVIKVGTSLERITETEEQVLRAGARTHLATGAPIVTHTERGRLSEAQLDVFEREGVAAGAVTISHLCFCPDLDEVRRVARRGAFIEFDQAPKPKYGLEDEVIRRIVTLAGEGFPDQILVSGDFSRKSYFRHWSGGPGLGYLLGPFRARLQDELDAAGLDGAAITHALFTTNPQRALRFRGPGASATANAIGWHR